MLGTVGGFFTGGGEAAAAARGVKAGGSRFAATARRFTADETGAMRLPAKTPWGWTGTKAYRVAVGEVEAGGTLETVGGHIPSQAEAQMLIDDAGGIVQRIEGPHLPPNPHQYPHINFTTKSGARGTVKIR